MNAKLTLVEIQPIETLAPEKRSLIEAANGTSGDQTTGWVRLRIQAMKGRVAAIREQELAVYWISEDLGGDPHRA